MDSWLPGTRQYCKKLNRYNIKNSIKPSEAEGVFLNYLKYMVMKDHTFGSLCFYDSAATVLGLKARILNRLPAQSSSATHLCEPASMTQCPVCATANACRASSTRVVANVNHRESTFKRRKCV